MTWWLKRLSRDQRKLYLTQKSLTSGITEVALEKDLWVTLTLFVLANSALAPFFTFKGGTSLSKGFKLIERFSEDIDIAVDPACLGMFISDNPSKTSVEKLKRQGCLFTEQEIKEAIKHGFKLMALGEETPTVSSKFIQPNRPDTDPHTLFVHYHSLFGQNPYIVSTIRVEFSVRSVSSPFRICSINTLIEPPQSLDSHESIPFQMRTLDPQVTFIEKALLLHEEFNNLLKPQARTQRMSRHYYDLYRLKNNDLFYPSLGDKSLFLQILEKRKRFSRLRGIDYEKVKSGKLILIPANQETKQQLQKDYELMQDNMIYGSTPGFNELLNELSALEMDFERWLN